MTSPVILASTSEIRAQMFRAAHVPIEIQPARVDEDAIKAAMVADDSTPRDIADALAEMKARKTAGKFPDRLVIGADQVLALKNDLFSKPETPEQALEQLKLLKGQVHTLYSAAVIYENLEPVWRHVGVVRLRMRDASDGYLQNYVDRNWDSIRHSVGSYKLEEEGIRLMQSVQGDYFHVLGMPMLEILAYLTLRGVIDG